MTLLLSPLPLHSFASLALWPGVLDFAGALRFGPSRGTFDGCGPGFVVRMMCMMSTVRGSGHPKWLNHPFRAMTGPNGLLIRPEIEVTF